MRNFNTLRSGILLLGLLASWSLQAGRVAPFRGEGRAVAEPAYS